jgi:hypothetical protein
LYFVSVPFRLLQAMICGIGLEFLVVVAFHCMFLCVIVFVASGEIWNCCVSSQCTCVSSHLLQVTIFGSSLKFLVVVAFHCMFLCVIAFVASGEIWN